MLQDSSVRRGSLFKITEEKILLLLPCGGPILVKIVKWIELELSVIETLFTFLGLKRELTSSHCWKEQGMGQVQAQRNPQVSPSLSLLLTPVFVPF